MAAAGGRRRRSPGRSPGRWSGGAGPAGDVPAGRGGSAPRPPPFPAVSSTSCRTSRLEGIWRNRCSIPLGGGGGH